MTKRNIGRCLLLSSLLHPPTPSARLMAQDAGASETRSHVAAIELSEERLDAVVRFVRSNRARLGLPGVAVSVATADSVVLAFADGGRQRDDAPITEHTPFLIGSVTKTLTATVTVHEARRGVLDLDAPIETYLPAFSMRPPFVGGSITLRHLLGHRSGLSQWSGHDRRAQHEGRFDHLAPGGPPNESAEYSSLNYIVLGRVLEESTGKPYARLLDDVLFGPLHMQAAFVDGSGSGRTPDLARGHQSYFGLQKQRVEPEPPPHLVPAGFAGASAYDLGRYGGMLVGRGGFAGDRILDEQTVAELLGPLGGSGTALGWGRRRIGERLVIEHSGNTRTSAARMRLVPNAGYALTVLTNTNSGPFFDAADALLDGIDEILQGQPANDPPPMERLFKGVILVGTTLSLVGMAQKARAWGRAGRPVVLTPSSSARLALDVGIGAGLLLGIPRLAGVPLSTMVAYFPDLGIGLAVSAGAGIVGGLLHAFTRSAPGGAS